MIIFVPKFYLIKAMDKEKLLINGKDYSKRVAEAVKFLSSVSSIPSPVI